MSARTVLDGEAAVRAAVGSELGAADWFAITTDTLAQFAAATGDADCTYLAVSLSNMFLPQIVEVRGFAMGINYGTDAVRLLGTLEAGDHVRASAHLVDVADVRGGIQTRMIITIEAQRDGGTNGRAIAEIDSLSRWLDPTR